MKKFAIITMTAVAGYISAINYALGKSDWEYWSRYSFEAPVVSNISVVVKPE